MGNTKKVMVYLDAETIQMIEKLAGRNKTSKSQVVRESILELHSRTFKISRNRHKDPTSTSET